jgi:hypothetical protein
LFAVNARVLATQPLRELVPTIPALVEQVVSKALAKDPRERFASIRDFAEALERAGVSEEITASAPPPGRDRAMF